VVMSLRIVVCNGRDAKDGSGCCPERSVRDADISPSVRSSRLTKHLHVACHRSSCQRRESLLSLSIEVWHVLSVKLPATLIAPSLVNDI